MHILSSKKWIFVALLVALSAAGVSAQPYAYVSSFGNNISLVTPTGTVANVIYLSGTTSGIAVTPDGNYLFVACQGSNSVRVVSLATNTQVNNIAVGSLPVQLAITPNGAQAYVLDRGSFQVSVINVASQTLTTNIPVASKPMQVVISPDSSRAYVSLYGGTIAVIDTASNTVVGSYPATYGMSSIVLANGQLYAGNQSGGSVMVYDASGNAVTTITGLASPNWLAATPDGSRIYATNGNGTVSVINTATKSVIATLSTGSLPTSVAVSADGAYAYVANEYSNYVTQISTSTNSIVLNSGRVGPYPYSVATSPATGPPPPPPCTYTLSANSASFPAAGGTGSVTVTPSATCTGSWTAASNVAWASITSATSFSGPGTVTYSVNPDLSSVGQSGTLTLAGQTYTITESGLSCTYTLSATSASFSATGGTGSVNVTAPAGCGWTASSGVAWAQVTGGASGSGSGTVSYSVNPNASSVAASGALTVAGQTYAINEAGVACSFSLSATSGSFTSTGGTGSVNVTAPAGCGWTASSGVAWTQITSGASGSGNGTVGYTVSPNAGSTGLSGSLSIAGQTYSITESGVACSFSLSATSASFTSTGGTGGVNVTAPAGCGWTASSGVAWTQVTSGASGSGNGTVDYTVSPNAGSTSLTGSLTIAGQTYTVTEAGVGCTFTLSANSASFPANGGTGSVNVTAPSGCGWNAGSNVAWAQVTGGASGSGSGTVSYSVNANNSSIAASGSLTIAGQTYTLSEAGVACSFSLSATSGSFTSTGGTGSVNVTAPAGCGWTASSGAAWTQITSGVSGNGNGTVGYTVSPNTGGTGLNGSLTIAGQNYSITESGVSCTFSLSATSNSFPATGGAGTLNVTAPSGCGWTATSGVAWTQITGGASGSGNGTVSYSVNSNQGTSSLTGALTIAGQTYTVTEAGIACTYTLSANSDSLSSASGSGSVNITANGSCGWTATSDSAWLTITAGFSGSGNGTVSFSTTANTGLNPRTGNLTIGAQNFAVTQAGVAFTPIRIHAGGPQVTDSNGNVWAADPSANSSVTTNAVANTTSPAIYQTEAWSTGTLTYQFTVPNGSHTLTLKFNEFYVMARGERVFDILINGLTYALSVDILNTVGPNTAYDLVYPLNVTNGQVTIQLRPLTGSTAKINAIQIQ